MSPRVLRVARHPRPLKRRTHEHHLTTEGKLGAQALTALEAALDACLLTTHKAELGARARKTRPFAGRPSQKAVADATCEIKLRSAEDGAQIMHGLIVPYSTWTEIHSSKEGHFLERFLPRSLARSLVEDRARIEVLFQHGMDPLVATSRLPRSPICATSRAARHMRRVCSMRPTCGQRAPGLEAGSFGTSGTFRVLKDELRQRPARSELQPEGATRGLDRRGSRARDLRRDVPGL